MPRIERTAKTVASSIAAAVVAATAALPVTVSLLSVLAFLRWRIVPLGRISVNLWQSAVWYWAALLAPAFSGAVFPCKPGCAGVAGGILAVAAVAPCIAGMTGCTLEEILSAALSRRMDFGIIALAAASGGAVAGLLAAVLRLSWYPPRVPRGRV